MEDDKSEKEGEMACFQDASAKKSQPWPPPVLTANETEKPKAEKKK